MGINTIMNTQSMAPQQEVETTKIDNSSLKSELIAAGVQSLIWGGLAYTCNNYNEYSALTAGQIFLGSKLAHLAQKRLGLNPSIKASVITGISATLLYKFKNPLVLLNPEILRYAVECAISPALAIGKYALGTIGVVALTAGAARVVFLGAREFAKEVNEFSAQIHEISSSQAEVNTQAADAIKELETT